MTGSEDGDERDLIEWIARENTPWMYRLCRRILGEQSLAEDGVQEALISAFRKLPELEDPGALKAWLYRVTLNHCLQILRKRGRLNEDMPIEHQPEFDQNNCRIEPAWTHFESPDKLMQRKDLRAIILSSIDQLPDKYRLVILLRDIEEFSTAEAAEMLQLSEANVKVRLHRARAALKVLLEPLMRGESQ